MSHDNNDDRAAILSRRDFLVRSALLSTGIGAAASTASAPRTARADPQICLEPLPAEPVPPVLPSTEEELDEIKTLRARNGRAKVVLDAPAGKKSQAWFRVFVKRKPGELTWTVEPTPDTARLAIATSSGLDGAYNAPTLRSSREVSHRVTDGEEYLLGVSAPWDRVEITVKTSFEERKNSGTRRCLSPLPNNDFEIKD